MKHAHKWVAVTPARQLSTEWTASDSKQEESKWGGWEATGALWELHELSSIRELPSVFIGVGAHEVWTTCRMAATSHRASCLPTKGAGAQGVTTAKEWVRLCPPTFLEGWGSVQELWPTCKSVQCFSRHIARAHFGPNQGRKQDQQSITTCTGPPRWLLQGGESVLQCLRHPLSSYWTCQEHPGHMV